MNESPRSTLWLLAAMPLVVATSMFVGFKLGRPTRLPEPQGTALYLVEQEIRRSYVDEVDPHALLDRAIAAMAALDDYSDYVPPHGVAAFVEQTTGTYEGIGMVPFFAADGLFVRIPMAGGPADAAGLLPGDQIVAIDGTALGTMTAEERQRVTAERLRGPAGTTVRLSVHRRDGDVEIAVERRAVQKRSVKWQQLLVPAERLGYAYVADFHPGCRDELQGALRDLEADGSPLRGLVLDLRFDGGGNLDECVAMARLFLAEGNIVTLRRRGSEVVERHDADGTAPWAHLPIAVLVNASTASASEVLTGALQDNHRAVVVGTETYGKGVVNTVFQWRDLDFRLKLTTAHYYTPSGRNLERDRKRRTNGGGNGNGGDTAPLPPGGIQPDRVVALDAHQQDAVQRALGEQPFAERHRAALTEWSLARGLSVPGIVGADADPQLAAAIAALREQVAAGGTPADDTRPK